MAGRHFRSNRLFVFMFAMLVAAKLLMAAEPAERAESNYWMTKKMEYSQNILRGLAKADFAAIEKSARSMNELTEIEKWLRGNTSEYKRHLASFQAANKELIETAKDKNIDGATLAYMQLTMSCVQCHKLVRDSDKESAKPE